MDQEAHDDLLYAQALLGHSVPDGDPAQVFARALKTLVAHLEKQKFAKTDRPRPCRESENVRHVPAEVKRTVWERDGGQCTFVSENGHRCDARTRLEFDHVEPVATGGHATVQGLRLRCRAHNQFTAEQAFGRDFMNAKREGSAKAVLPEHVAEVVPWLRSVGFKADEARRLAECCEGMPDAPLEARVRHALKCSASSRRPARARSGCGSGGAPIASCLVPA
jgi:5-methylcytosine-specific restriction endonuclease McrA